jgi:Matrixin
VRGRILCLLLAAAALSTASAAERYSYWVEPCTHAETGCLQGDDQLAGWALEAWQAASGGALEFVRVQDREHARIRVLWASGQQGLYGETHRIRVDGKAGAEVYVLPAPLGVHDDRLMRDAVVYLTCLHETGHALGLQHTAAFADIMYSFQYGGDIPEYFGRYRRKLHTREDIRKNSGLSEADRAHLMEAIEKSR